VPFGKGRRSCEKMKGVTPMRSCTGGQFFCPLGFDTDSAELHVGCHCRYGSDPMPGLPAEAEEAAGYLTAETEH